MYILDSIVKTCSEPALGKLLSIIKTVFNLIQLIGPILAIISLIIILVKLIADPDNKKLKSAFKNWLIALLMLFFIPLIVNVTMQFFDDQFTISECWNYAENNSSDEESTYIDSSTKKPTTIITNPDDYEIENADE